MSKITFEEPPEDVQMMFLDTIERNKAKNKNKEKQNGEKT